MRHERLAGTWDLVSYESIEPDGTVRRPFGDGLTWRRVRRPLCILLLLTAAVFPGCRDLDVVTASYATLAEARRAGAVARGRIPEGLPPGTREMREAFDPDTNRRWGLFSFPPSEADHLRAILEADEFPLEGQQCDMPRRIEWWPLLLRGRLDPERIQTTGLRGHRTRDGSLVFVVNWKQGRAYYWSGER